jgi:hypothetical protein
MKIRFIPPHFLARLLGALSESNKTFFATRSVTRQRGVSRSVPMCHRESSGKIVVRLEGLRSLDIDVALKGAEMSWRCACSLKMTDNAELSVPQRDRSMCHELCADASRQDLFHCYCIDAVAISLLLWRKAVWRYRYSRCNGLDSSSWKSFRQIFFSSCVSSVTARYVSWNEIMNTIRIRGRCHLSEEW